MISKNDIAHLKDLARVEFGEHETDALARDMDAILDYMSALKEANIDNVQEMTHAFDIQNIVRVDQSVDGIKEEYTKKARSIIDAFPEKEKTYLKVKAIF
ncbi:MAG: Asp-tRNA(Asn)/Glu-tRNA(Gln) amidotransferase subunit GatC [Patescibacteria group bacterium]